MSPSENDDDVKPTPPDRSTVILLLGTIGDTTWRMFIPTIGMTVLGLFVDKWLHTTPWLMIVAMIIGIALTVVLVKRQIKQVKK
ncbi:MAG TPA: AtpZ/AtpI family protein [Candidatus Saccharimonadales bacterium]|nr:AtpZ/AtpI family protein [Candidatus Saccharimonadales bacterium]